MEEGNVRVLRDDEVADLGAVRAIASTAAGKHNQHAIQEIQDHMNKAVEQLTYLNEWCGVSSAVPDHVLPQVRDLLGKASMLQRELKSLR